MKIKKYRITAKMVAKWFEYSSPDSFNNSTAKPRILRGIEQLLSHIDGEILKRFKL